MWADAQRFRPPRRVLLLACFVVGVGVIATLLNSTVGLGGSLLSNVVLPILGEAILAAAIVTMALRALLVRRDRAAWVALSCGALAWMSGDVYRLIAFPPGSHRFFPSPADAGYLLLYPCAYVGLWLLIRGRASSIRPSTWLDGLIGGCGVAAIGASFLVGFVLDHTGGSVSTVATNVAYPLADVLLLAQLVAAMSLSGWRPGRTLLLIAAGVTVFAVADSAYAYTSAIGETYVVAIGPLWILAFVLIAAAACRQEGAVVARRLPDEIDALVVPLVFALIATTLLAAERAVRIPVEGVVLAVVTLLLVILRTAMTFRENLALLDSRRASLTDDLTDLPNRRRFNERVAELGGADGERLAGLLMVDLDGFKELNDTLGHHAGDRLIEGLGSRLKAIGGLDLVARLGGDEFAVVVAGAPDPELLRSAAAKVQAAIEHPVELDELSVHVRASVGGALCADDGDGSDLMRHADVAMYNAKEGRTGYELYRPERDPNSRDRLLLLGELRTALEVGELVVFFQPKADARSRTVTGVEALVRWKHPSQGLLMPDRFLGVAESGGLMRKLTTYVLERALEQLAEWNAAGAELNVAVNLAMPNLLDLSLPDEVARALQHTGVEPSCLVLEITENVVMADPVRVLDVVGRLHALGVGLSLDDFGAGASSLGYLKRLSVDELKIDRSFVTSMDSDEDNASIVRATIDLAHNLGLKVVAEGVETTMVWQHLQELGCDEIQGFLLGRPMPAAQLVERLTLRSKLLPLRGRPAGGGRSPRLADGATIAMSEPRSGA
jgi:diguanylate cyclase